MAFLALQQIGPKKSRDVKGEVRASRERMNSRDKSREGREGMQQISNRCKEIEQRVRALIDKKKEQQKEQRNPNLPVINGKQQPYIKYNYQRPSSRERDLSRNKSIELARQQSSIQRQNSSKRSLERPASRERLASLERNHSKDSERRRAAGLMRYKF